MDINNLKIHNFKITETDIAMNLNNLTLQDYFDRLALIATSLFTWKGLDEIGGNSRFLEQTLFTYGRACFIKDTEKGYMSLCVNPSDTYNVYNLPTKVNAWSLGYSKNYDFDDIVYIMNNEMQLPTMNHISLQAYRLYEAQRTIDVNINAQKTPILIEGDSKSLLTLKNLYMKYSGNEPFIFGNKNFNLDKSLNVLKTDAPYIADNVQDYKQNVWNETLTFLGINNTNIDKKERLITDEVNSNNELIEFYFNCFYKTRKKACDEINNKFFNGEEKVKIEVNENIKSMIDDIGGDLLGTLYDNNKNTEEE